MHLVVNVVKAQQIHTVRKKQTGAASFYNSLPKRLPLLVDFLKLDR